MRQKPMMWHGRRSDGPGGEETSSLPIHIQLLGGFRVAVGDRVVPDSAWQVQKARSLVKILCLAPRHQLHREQIIDLLWPELEPEAVSGNLRSIVHAARSALDPQRAPGDLSRLHIRQDVFVLETGDGGTIDVELFNAAAQEAFRSNSAAAYESALNLYGGDLLPEDRYEDWAVSAREDLRETWLSLLVSLALLHESRDEYAAGIAAFERVVTADPTHEDAHAGLMRLYALTGRHGQALRQYARLRDVLERELDVEPSGATRRLHAEIAAGHFPPQDTTLPRPAGREKRPRHNLPEPLTSFIGRRPELDEIGRNLRDARLVTLIGAGGSGKSRLALELAREAADDTRNDVWLVELASLADPTLVPGAVAAAIGIREGPNEPLITTLVKTLSSTSALLVLDNCEHLIDACATLVEALLAGCPDLRILATSREALRVPGEVAWRVPPLSMPTISTDVDVDLQRLAENDAVALFVDRVRWVRPGFALSDTNAAAVAQICQRLDGMPLALELAAARSSVLTPEQLAARLDDALRLLSEGSRTAPDRQQTLRATLDWSYRLLDSREQVLLRRLAVFAGDWTLETAETVCAGPIEDGGCIESHDVLPLLAHLVDKSLVQVEDSSSGTEPIISPGVRYRLLETVRQYATEQLVTADEAHDIRDRHADFYVSLAEQAEPALTGPDQAVWLARLEREHDNLRTALRWLAEIGDIERNSRLTVAVWRLWHYHGYLVEGARWVDSVLSRPEVDTIPVVRRARLLFAAGTLAWKQADVARAKDLSRHALALFQEAGEPGLSAGALHSLGVVAEIENRYADAENYYREALPLWDEAGNTTGAGYTLNNLGNVARELGNLDDADRLYERELKIGRETGNTRVIALALAGLCVVALDRGNYAQAEAFSRESHELYQSLGARSLNLMNLQNLGYAILYQGRHREALELHAECLRLTLESGDKRMLACGLEAAAAAVTRIDPAGAARIFGAAEALREAIGVPITQADFKLIERPLADARERIGTEAFDAAWAAGRSLSPDDAVAETIAARSTIVDEPRPQPPSLSRREREVATLLAAGQTNAQIAVALNIARPTVDKHVSNILGKLGFSSRTEVREWACEHDLIPNDDPRSR